MSTQKLPMVGELRREKPRTKAMATAMPMTGLSICSQRQRADLREVRHRRLAAVVLPVGVGHERGGGVEAERLGHGAQVLRVERERPLDPDQQVGDAHGHSGEDDHGGGVALPVLLLLGAGPEQPVDRPLGPAEEVHPPVEDGGHVGAQVAPGQAEGDDQGDDGPVKPMSELLGLEHGDAQVEEHHDGQRREGSPGSRSYPVQRPDEPEHRRDEAHDAEHCEEVSHGPMLAARL